MHNLLKDRLSIEENLKGEKILTKDKVFMNRLRTDFPTEISCDFFPKCPGCKKQKDVCNPPIWKIIQDFFISKGFLTPQKLISGEIISWRSKVKLAVRGTVDCPKIGLFEEKSHRIVDITSCPLHYPVMDEAGLLIRQEMKNHRVIPYQEESSTGRLRYLQMVVNRSDLRIQLTLVVNGNHLLENEIAFLGEIQKNPIFHSIWVNFLPGSTNTVIGKDWQLVFGEEDFWQEIRGISFCFHPSCFSQAHVFVFEQMIFFIETLLNEGVCILELYAGVGCIGLLLARKAANVVLVESSPKARACFEKTLSKLEKRLFDKCTFISASVEEGNFSWSADVILVDPPRKGLSRKCKEKIFFSSAKQVIYISCGPESFMRDCEEFLAEGWILHQTQSFLLFPGSDHVEIIASFKKQV